MGTISNRILITAISDGTTIHGSLRASGSLSQGYTGSGCIPDWSSGGPYIYLTLFDGATAVSPLTYTWYYNGNAIFTQDSASGAVSTDGKFKHYTSYTVGGTSYKAIQIVGNIATSDNLNMDLVKIVGTVEIGGAPVDFSAGVDIAIKEVNANGWLGVINLADGKSTLDGDTDTVVLTGALYKNGTFGDWTARWMLNGVAITSSAAGLYVLSNNGKTLTLYGSAVTDIATVVCEFYEGSTVTASAFATSAMVTIDDTRDAEYMHIRYIIDSQSTVTNGAPLSLHSGQKVTYKMWVATSSDSNNVNTSFTKFYAEPHNASGTVIGSSAFTSNSGAPLYGGTYSSGWCDITASVTTDDGSSATGGQFSVHYNDVKTNGSNLSIIVKAE